MEIIKSLTDVRPTPEQIQQFEAKLGMSLPDDYKVFLRECNGGRPAFRRFSLTKSGAEFKSGVEWFFSLYEGKHNNLDTYFFGSPGNIPLRFLPIASDPVGNLLLISLRKQGVGPFGSVYFWDHEDECETAPTMRNMYKLADSFTAFIEGLTP